MEQKLDSISFSIRRTLEDLRGKAKEVDSALFNSWYGIPVSPIRDKPFELWSGKHPDCEQDSDARHFLLQGCLSLEGPVSIVWRKEYERIQNSIEVAYKEKAGGVIINGLEQGLLLLKNVYTAIMASPSFDTNTSILTFRYVYIAPQAKMSKKSVWPLSGFSSCPEVEGSLYYLPICWDAVENNFYSPRSIELTDDEAMDVDDNIFTTV